MATNSDYSSDDSRQSDGQSQSSAIYLSQEAVAVLEELGGEAVVKTIRDTGKTVEECDAALAGCTLFHFSAEHRLEKLLENDASLGFQIFWIEINQLLVSSIRSFCHSFRKLISGIGDSVTARNDLSTALTIRAFLEHACTLDQLASKVDPLNEVITTQVWPSWMQGTHAARPSDEHLALRRELVRYISGYRTDVVAEDIPLPTDSNAQWKKFTDKYEKATPQDLQAYSPMKVIYYSSKQPGYRHMRLLYALLCEYVHPNSMSRNADFVQTVDGLSSHTLNLQPVSESIRGFKRVVSIGNEAIIRSCERIRHALQIMSASVLPISPPLGGKAGDMPPIGAILARDPHGRLFWVDPTKVVVDPNRRLQELTDEQIERTKKIALVFEEVCLQSIQVWCDNFAYNPDPEQEIREFEHMASVYEQEIAERKDANVAERHMVFRALVFAGHCRTIGELLSSHPELKALVDLERIFSRIKS
jgi:hypothetical protein